MKRRVLGVSTVALASAAIITAVFLASAYTDAAVSPGPGATEIPNYDDSSGVVAPGFVGSATFGDWSLICAAAPAIAEADAPFDRPDASPAEQMARNNCQLTQQIMSRDEPRRLVLAANLSLVGSRRHPALMLRLPATVQAGDSVVMRADGDSAAEALVRDCAPGECMAADSLSDAEWARLIGADALQVVFPMDEGPLVFVDLGVDGLSEAAAALQLAQGGAAR